MQELMISRKICKLSLWVILSLPGAMVASLPAFGHSSAKLPGSDQDGKVQVGDSHAGNTGTVPVDAVAQQEMLIPNSVESSQEEGTTPAVMMQVGPDGSATIVGSDSTGGAQPTASVALTDESTSRQAGQIPDSDVNAQEGVVTPEEALILMQGEPDGTGQ